MRAGDPRTAEGICREALKKYPRDANLLCLLGASLIKQNRAAEAEQPLRRAAKLFPRLARAHEGLSEACIMQGKLEDALSSLRLADELEPNNAAVQLKLGRVLAALGRGQDADAAFEASFKLTPFREQLVRGLELQRLGSLEEAEKIYRDVLLRNPDDVDALRLLSGLAMRVRQWGDAEVMLKRALEIAPDFYQGWMDLGLAQQEQDKLEEAHESFLRAGRLEPQRPQPDVGAGTTLAMRGRHDEAIALFEAALGKDPRSPNALAGIGHVLKTVGKQERAIEAYRQCMRYNPAYGEAYWSLANLKTFRFEDAEIAAMEKQLEQETLADELRANFLFALGKAYEDRGDFDAAFDFYFRGNELRRRHESYDPVQTEVIHDRIIDVFSRDFIESRQGHGHPSAAPILIVGLPRSGSTLIEQILASHSEVEGTHELPELSRVTRSLSRHREDRKTYPEAVLDLDNPDFRALGQQYLDRTMEHRTGAAYFTDKMPNNFPHVGFLHLILPNAKVINAKRHPLDSCLGSYKQLFARGQPFTYDLYEIGEYYLQYQRMMDYWHAVLPGRVLDVQYEDVVVDLEEQVRRLLDYCELPWEDACLNFHETERAIKTASSEQVRRPIYDSSVQLWRNYERHLGPLIEVLEPLLAELPKDWQP